MKSYKLILLCSVVFQPFCFGMEPPDTIEKNYKNLKPYLGKEILDKDCCSDNNIDKATEKYQEAIKLWDIDIQHALRCMLEAEKLEHKGAKEKLKEIRKLKTYNDPKIASTNDSGMLLKFFEIPPRAQYNAIMDWQGINKEYALDYFIELAECEDTPKNIKKQIIEQLTKIRKTNSYRKPSTVQSPAQFNNIGYLLYEKEKNHTKPSATKKNVKNSPFSVQNSKNSNGEKINNNLDSANGKKKALKNENADPQYVAGQFHKGIGANTENSQGAFKPSQIAFSQPKNVNQQERADDIYSKTQGASQDSEETLKYFNFAINQITLETQFSLGLMYFYGQGVEKDFGKALTYFKLAADQGHAYAQFNLGAMYFEALGISSQNLKEAARYFKLAANQKYAQAQFSLGVMYFEGLGVTQNLEKAIRYFKLAADQGHVEAQFTLSSMYYKGQGVKKNLKKTLKFCKLAALQGHQQAQFSVGVMYYKGQEGEQDLGEAIRYFKLAADQGHVEAQFNLGVMYSDNQGVENNLENALKYYKLAADQGHAEAQFNLGAMYYTAEGVKKDLEEAVKYFTLAADQGHAEAQFNLGAMCYSGEGVEKDFEKSFRWFKLAADQGCAEAQFNLAIMYSEAVGVAQNFKEALRYYELAVDQDHADAQFNLGVMYSEAQGVTQNLKETLKHYKLAADQGHAEAQFNLGVMYYNAEGVEEDLDEAVRYFTLAADQGHEEAQFNLDSMDAHNCGVVKRKNHQPSFAQELGPASQREQNFTKASQQFNQISMLDKGGAHEPLLNDSHVLFHTAVPPQNLSKRNKSFARTQQTAKHQSAKFLLEESNTSESVFKANKTLMDGKEKTNIRKTQSFNNLKFCHSSFENFKDTPINISSYNNKKTDTISKAQSVIDSTSSSKVSEGIVIKNKKEQKKNKLSISQVKLKDHLNDNKKVIYCNSINVFGDFVLNESTDCSSSEKSVSDTPFEALFKQDGKRDENLKQLKKLLTNRDLRKASEIKLSRSIVVRALRELGPNGKRVITWNFETNGNKNRSKISADIVRKTNNVNIPSLNIHLHSPKGKWYDDVNIKNHFLDFIRFCDPGVNALIEEIERK